MDLEEEAGLGMYFTHQYINIRYNIFALRTACPLLLSKQCPAEGAMRNCILVPTLVSCLTRASRHGEQHTATTPCNMTYVCLLIPSILGMSGLRKPENKHGLIYWKAIPPNCCSVS